MFLRVPERVGVNCSRSPESAGWLWNLPAAVHELERRWNLRIGEPFAGPEVSCAWVAPITRANGSPAVLKLGMPHMEGRDEIAGLRFWNGDPTVRLLDSDDSLNAMLLERCEPGTPLRALPEAEQDVILARLLRRLWRTPPPGHGFRPLSEMLDYWAAESRAASNQWPDSALVEEGLHLFHALPRSAESEVLLATDLHAGNVLSAQRSPFLVIDPKPFVGDPAYDATQHLFNCPERMRADPIGTVRRFSDLLEVDSERVRLYAFARAAAECRDDWTAESMYLARKLSN